MSMRKSRFKMPKNFSTRVKDNGVPMKVPSMQFSLLRVIHNCEEFLRNMYVLPDNLENAIKRKFSDALEDGYLDKCARDKTAYFVERLYETMCGFGTTDSTLIRIIITLSEIDLATLETYEKLYGKSLAEAITISLANGRLIAMLNQK